MGDDAGRSAVPFNNNSEGKSYAFSGKIMLSAIIILFFVVVLMVGLHLYARWYLLRARRRQLLLRRRNRMNHERRTQIVFYVDNNNPNNNINLLVSDPANRGLEPSVLNSLPKFVYSSKTHSELMDCAVCLSEFEENELGRILPKCKHSFHIECIDMWFHSHSTCPLCRAPVEKWISHESEEGKNSGDVVIELGNESGGTRVEPGCSSSQHCGSCKEGRDDGEFTGSSSLGVRRKGMDFAAVRIDIPMRSESENELTLSSPASTQGYRSPGARLLSLKRILSMGRKTPSTPPTGATTATPRGASCSEVESNRGTTELTRMLTPR